MKRKNAAESAPAEKKQRTRLPLSAYLSYLLVATTLLTGVTFSGYLTAANGSDSARVAKFEILEAGTLLSQPISASLAPGDTVIRTIQVQNNSEVSVEYGVDLVRVTGNLPEFELDLQKSGGDETEVDVNTFQMAAGETATFTLSIHWPEESSSPDYAGKADELRVVVTATQMD